MDHEIIRKKITVDSHQVMTYSVGQGKDVLFLLHGGPGCPCNYLLEAHKSFADFGFRIVTWDQLGCGESDKPSDPSLWHLPRFVEEVETVRTSLRIDHVFLLGQSFGGVLGLEYCLKHPEHVKAFIAADTSFDLPHMQRGFERKKSSLGEETYTMMARREAEGTTTHVEYQAAITLLMYRHMCRAEKWPEALTYSFANIAQPVFSKMFGPYFFNCSGNIRHHNRMDQLPNMKIPTLIIHGEHDYIIPEVACIARDNLPNVELAMLRNCSHLPFYEDPEGYQQVLLTFLNKHR